MKALTQQEYITKASIVHNNNYDYTNTQYINSTTKIIITCPIHGSWETNPRNHLKGCGCPKCKGRSLSTAEWITRFNNVHANKFDYSKFEYTSIYEKSIIICKTHGEFKQSPHNHVNGQQCPKCSRKEAWVNNTYYNTTNAHKYKESWGAIQSNLYVLKFKKDKEVFYKVGITSQDLSRRFRKSDFDYTYEVLYLKPMSLYDAVILEQSLLNLHFEFKYTPLLKFAGHTECLSYFNTKTLP